jgi:hypothetical protein
MTGDDRTIESPKIYAINRTWASISSGRRAPTSPRCCRAPYPAPLAPTCRARWPLPPITGTGAHSSRRVRIPPGRAKLSAGGSGGGAGGARAPPLAPALTSMAGIDRPRPPPYCKMHV